MTMLSLMTMMISLNWDFNGFWEWLRSGDWPQSVETTRIVGAWTDMH